MYCSTTISENAKEMQHIKYGKDQSGRIDEHCLVLGKGFKSSYPISISHLL